MLQKRRICRGIEDDFTRMQHSQARHVARRACLQRWQSRPAGGCRMSVGQCTTTRRFGVRPVPLRPQLGKRQAGDFADALLDAGGMAFAVDDAANRLARHAKLSSDVGLAAARHLQGGLDQGWVHGLGHHPLRIVDGLQSRGGIEEIPIALAFLDRRVVWPVPLRPELVQRHTRYPADTRLDVSRPRAPMHDRANCRQTSLELFSDIRLRASRRAKGENHQVWAASLIRFHASAFTINLVRMLLLNQFFVKGRQCIPAK